MTPFTDFVSEFGPAEDVRRASEEKIQKYQGIAPSSLLEHWEDKGFGTYMDGFLIFTDPEDFDDLIHFWLPKSKSFPFLRTAFGDIYTWSRKKIVFISVHENWTKELTDNIDPLFEMLFFDKEYVKEGLWGRMYKPTRKLLGALKPDEIYAPVPALALGGDATAKKMQKVKLREHLLFLGQLTEEKS